MAIAGALLKTTQTALRTVQLLASLVILGIYSYFLATETRNGMGKPRSVQAVEGISGAAVLYTLFAVLLTCFIGGITVSVILAILLDVLFIGAFIAVAWMTRSGARNCRGTVDTPIGGGNSITNSDFSFPGVQDAGTVDYVPNLFRACNLQKAVFAVAIILIGLFIVTMLFELALRQHHRKEKRYGPSPKNNYTTGSRRKFRFGRKNKGAHDAELGTVGAGAVAGEKHNDHHHGHGVRPSHDTGITGTTMGATDGGYNGTNKYNTTGYGNPPTAAGGHAPPVGSVHNPHAGGHAPVTTNY
ncbi:MAG: hypothetical protein M1817_004742 [Caeruleum heppii]|nr:MAG: hypothetical protein M1817_004742 [Caeruleum heppii]